MTTQERTAWEQLVDRAAAQHSSLAASIAFQERTAGNSATIRTSDVWRLENDRRQLAEYDAVLAANAELLRFRGQEG